MSVDVAVVIPCFNDGHVVGDAVASAIREGAAEVIVVNDGSTDAATVTRLANLESPIVRVIHQENKGLAAARTTGLRATLRPLVMVLDADDEVAPGALESMATAMALDQSLAVVWGDVERFGQAGKLIYKKGSRLDPWRITFVNEIVASTMVRREVVLSVGGWSLDDAFEDWDLWMTLAERGWAGRHVGVTTLRYRVDDPRMYRKALRRYGELVRRLQSRHKDLFESRAASRRNSASSAALKILWTVIAGLPIPEGIRRYLLFGSLVLCEPGRRRRR